MGGTGEPVLLLHGYPQTRAMWHRVAPTLAEHHTVVAADLRGYGDSSKPPGDESHDNYSKRRWRATSSRRWRRSGMSASRSWATTAAAGWRTGWRCFAHPATIHGSCEDYRAAASIDLEHDRADDGRRIACPLLVLWGAHGVVERKHDPLALWRERADDVRGHALDCGHFLAEERPEETAAELSDFLRG